MPVTEPSLDRVLVVHNAYQQRGGEDAVVEAEVALLRARGHAVEVYSRSNDDIPAMPGRTLAAQTLWSRRTESDLRCAVLAFCPDIIHVHNTFPLISPSLHWAAAAHRVPLVQTLHNFRLLCPQAMLLRDGKVCEDCVGRVPWRAVARRCYRGSVAQSAALTTMLVLHRALGTWQQKVTRYIALNDFCRDKFIEGGLPAARIATKPNFVDMPAPPVGERSGTLFVGRLSPEKGVQTLANAARLLPALEFEVIGTGPESLHLKGLPNLREAGFGDAATVRSAMCRATCLVLPSICYENFPRTLVEALACGLPVIASRLGAMPFLVRDGVTGLLFEPGNAADLAAKLGWSQAHPDQMQQMGLNARAEYEAKYTAEINYRQLTAIYDEARHACAAD